jgi:hypothetical protein
MSTDTKRDYNNNDDFVDLFEEKLCEGHYVKRM